MDRDEHGVAGLDVAPVEGIGVGTGGGLPDPGLLNGEESLEVLADPGPLEQRLGDRGGAVAQGHQADSRAAQRPNPVGHVFMHRETGESVHDVLDRVLDRTVQRDPVEADSQSLDRDVGERLAAGDGGQREAVSEQPREPGLREMRGGPDLLEPLTHRGHVGERFVDVEDHEDGSPHAGLAHDVAPTRKRLVRHGPHRSPGLYGRPGRERATARTRRRGQRLGAPTRPGRRWPTGNEMPSVVRTATVSWCVR